MTVLLDTNVVLDVLLDRPPHGERAALLFAEVERGRLRGLLGATTVTTVHYLATKAVGARQARRHLQTLFAVAPVTREVLLSALEMPIRDYEDAVLHEAARIAGADAIVTRDRAGFARAQLRVYAPVELLAVLQTAGGADA